MPRYTGIELRREIMRTRQVRDLANW